MNWLFFYGGGRTLFKFAAAEFIWRDELDHA